MLTPCSQAPTKVAQTSSPAVSLGITARRIDLPERGIHSATAPDGVLFSDAYKLRSHAGGQAD